MPYIHEMNRKALGIDFSQFETVIDEPGELNYILSRVIDEYAKCRGECYRTYNDILGVLTAVQFELYRRFIGPYENKKIYENGDVFTFKDQSEVISGPTSKGNWEEIK